MDVGQLLPASVQEDKTALHWAAICGHKSVAAYLVGQGAALEAKDEVSNDECVS